MAGKPGQPAPAALNILVTNDDGIEAPGILAVAEALRPLGQVTVATPSTEMSGSSHGVTSNKPISVRESERGGQRWIAIDALPATCVRLAVEKLLPARPDIVISGINRGENLGAVTFYSATVGASREAAFLGLPSLSVNLVAANGMGFEMAAAITVQVVRALGREGLPKGTFLNVNIPPLPRERLRGVRITRQDTRAPIDHFDKMVAPDGSTAYIPRWELLEPDAGDADIWAVRNGYISVTIGNNVKIQNGISVYHGVTLEDGVFCGPHCVFTNARQPRAINADGTLKSADDWIMSETLVKLGASIGAHATIVCGITIGRWAMIGAGSVVTRDVPDYGLMYGNPARLRGFVCPCGEKLIEAGNGKALPGDVHLNCPRCHTQVSIPQTVYVQRTS